MAIPEHWPRRLNCGCGPQPADGWLNADRRRFPGVQVQADLCDGLPLPDAWLDYAVAIHLLQDLAWGELPQALGELRRVLKPGGTLRLALPDLERSIAAWQRGDTAWFHVPDEDARAIGAKLVTQAIWYGSVRTPFTWDFARELLERAGFVDVRRVAYRETATGLADITALDNRPRESLFVEARRCS